jgi:hypothetical protein
MFFMSFMFDMRLLQGKDPHFSAEATLNADTFFVLFPGAHPSQKDLERRRFIVVGDLWPTPTGRESVSRCSALCAPAVGADDARMGVALTATPLWRDFGRALVQPPARSAREQRKRPIFRHFPYRQGAPPTFP